MSELGRVFVTVGAKLDEFQQAMLSVDKSLKDANDKTKEWGEGFTETGKKLAIIGGAITAALGTMVYATAKAGEEINNLSTRYGIATETLSGYKLAADQNETSLQALAIGFKFLAKNIDEANKGNKEAKGAFDSLGISLKDVHGKTRPMNDILLDVADRFSKMENNEQKAIIATQIFGRSGNELIPFLNQGRDGLSALAEKAKQMGMVFTQDGASAADELGDAVTTLKDGMGGLGKTLVEGVIPQLTKMVNGMTEGVSGVTQFFERNKELATALVSVAGAVGLVASGMGVGMIAIGKIIPIFSGLASKLGTSIGALSLTAAGIGLVAGAAIAAYKIYKDYADAVEYAAQAEERFNEVSGKLEAKLKDAADAAGMTRAEFQRLKEKYEGNIAAMAMHIKKGDEGVKMQEALAKVGKEHSKVIEEQAKKLGIITLEQIRAKEAAEAYKAKLAQLKDELGLTFKADIADRIAKIKEALVLFKKELSPEQVKKLKEELNGLKEAARGGVRPLEDLTESLKSVKSELDKMSEVTENDNPLDWTSKLKPDKIDDVADSLRDGTIQVQKYGQQIEDSGKKTEDLADTTDKKLSFMQQAWANMVTDISQGWSRALVDMLGIHAWFVGEATKHNEDYYKKCFDDLEADYEARKQRILDEVTDVDEQKKQLLELDEWYDGEKKRIADDEEKSRDDHAKSELERQESLWTKVKSIFAKAVEDMLTAWVTKFVSKFLANIVDDILPAVKDIGDKGKDAAGVFGGAFEGIGGVIAGLATSIGTVITTLATAIGTGIVTIATAIAGAIVALATGIATAATVLAAAVPALALVGALALALYAGFAAIRSILDLGGGGAGDGMGRVVERQDKMLAMFDSWHIDVLNILVYCQGRLDRIVDQLDNLAGLLGGGGGGDGGGSYQRWDELIYNVDDFHRGMDHWGSNILAAISSLPHNAGGGIQTQPALSFIAEDEPEIIIPLEDYLHGEIPAGLPRPGAGAGGGVNIYYSPVIQAIDSQDVYRFMAGPGKDALIKLFRGNVGGLTREVATETGKF